MIWKYNFWQTLFLSSKSFSPDRINTIFFTLQVKWDYRYRYKILFLSEKSHEYENLQQFNNFSVTRLHFHFTSDFKDRMGRRRDIRAPFIFIIKPAQATGIHTQIHINDKKRKLLFDWYTMQALKRSCLGLEKHNYKSMNHG